MCKMRYSNLLTVLSNELLFPPNKPPLIEGIVIRQMLTQPAKYSQSVVMLLQHMENTLPVNEQQKTIQSTFS